MQRLGQSNIFLAAAAATAAAERRQAARGRQVLVLLSASVLALTPPSLGVLEEALRQDLAEVRPPHSRRVEHSAKCRSSTVGATHLLSEAG